jgi:Rrf2 family protein
MQVSRELDYGLRAVVVLALYYGSTLSKRRIAEEFKIPVNFLAIILPKLVHKGIVESLPGPKGGYRLARPSREVSIYDVVCAINDVFAFNRCLDVSKGCELAPKCPVRPHWEKVQRDTENYLKTVTFDKIASAAAAA